MNEEIEASYVLSGCYLHRIETYKQPTILESRNRNLTDAVPIIPEEEFQIARE